MVVTGLESDALSVRLGQEINLLIAVICQLYGVAWSMALQDMNLDHVAQLLREL